MKIKNLILILNLLSAGYLKSGDSSASSSPSSSSSSSPSSSRSSSPDNFWAQPAQTLWPNPAQSVASDSRIINGKEVCNRATQTENMTVADFSDTTHTNYFVVNKSLARTNNYNRAILRCLTVAAVFYFAWRSK